jgi:hypothetical protein
LKKDEDDNDDQHQRCKQGLKDLVHSLGYRLCLVKRDDVIHVRRKTLLQFRHQFSYSIGRGDRVAAGKLIERQDRGGFSIEPALDVVSLGAELDARDILHPHKRAVGVRADNDIGKFFR